MLPTEPDSAIPVPLAPLPPPALREPPKPSRRDRGGGGGGGGGPRRGGPGGRMQQSFISDRPELLIWRSDHNHLFYLIHEIDRPCIAVLPCVAVRSLADLNADDLHSFWSDIDLFMRSHNAVSRQVLVHQNDWRISPRVHAKITLTPQDTERLVAWMTIEPEIRTAA